jgi:E3 ubiquitin-protein ligase UBR4
MVDKKELDFEPCQVKFNPENQNFLALAGLQTLEVVTLDNKGKCCQTIHVELMLAEMGPHLLINNIEWVPGSQTIIAVGTNEFVRIYDLSQDNMSPIYNIFAISN